MRVCLLTPQFPPFHANGGVGAYVLTLAEGIGARGHDVTVCGVGIHPPGEIAHPWGRSVSLAMPRSLARGPWPAVLGAARRVVPAAASGVRDAVERAIGRSWQADRSRLLHRFAVEQPVPFDLVEAPNWGGYTGWFPRRCPWPVVVRLSSPASECKGVGSIDTEGESRACAAADLVISNTAANLNHCREAYGLPLEPALVIAHGVGDVPPSRAERPCDAVQFLSLARPEPRKGLDILAEAMIAILPRSRCTFAFLGTSRGMFEEAYPDLARRLFAVPGAVERVRFLGTVDEGEKRRRYEASHFVLVPSRYESFCLVAVEGLRAGTPFVAAPVGGLVDVAACSGVSRLVEANSPDAWARALLAIDAAGPAAAEELRASARADYERHFTPARMIDDTLAAYGRLLRGGAGRGKITPGT